MEEHHGPRNSALAARSAHSHHHPARAGLALTGRPNMATTSATIVDRQGGAVEIASTTESSRSAVSWGAVIGGAFAAGSISVILVILGSGLGLASVSPWSNQGASAGTLTVMTVIWIIVGQWLSAALGGYLTGRFRTRWTGIHAHEEYFRDSANGFVTWAVATVVVAVLLSSALTSLTGGALRGAATVAGGAAQGTTQAAGTNGNRMAGGSATDPSAYFIDTMFRSDTPTANATGANATGANASGANASAQDVKAESGRIMAKSLKDGQLAAPDKTYLAKLVAARTGLSQADAEKRVDEVYAQAKDAEAKAKQVADDARRAAAKLAIYTALSMIIGAFIAAVAAALGGAHRDEGWGYPR